MPWWTKAPLCPGKLRFGVMGVRGEVSKMPVGQLIEWIRFDVGLVEAWAKVPTSATISVICTWGQCLPYWGTREKVTAHWPMWCLKPSSVNERGWPSGLVRTVPSLPLPHRPHVHRTPHRQMGGWNLDPTESLVWDCNVELRAKSNDAGARGLKQKWSGPWWFFIPCTACVLWGPGSQGG